MSSTEQQQQQRTAGRQLSTSRLAASAIRGATGPSRWAPQIESETTRKRKRNATAPSSSSIPPHLSSSRVPSPPPLPPLPATEPVSRKRKREVTEDRTPLLEAVYSPSPRSSFNSTRPSLFAQAVRQLSGDATAEHSATVPDTSAVPSNEQSNELPQLRVEATAPTSAPIASTSALSANEQPSHTKNAIKKKKFFEERRFLRQDDDMLKRAAQAKVLAPFTTAAVSMIDQVDLLTPPDNRNSRAMLDWLLAVANMSLTSRGLQGLSQDSFPEDMTLKPQLLKALCAMVRQRLAFNPTDLRLRDTLVSVDGNASPADDGRSFVVCVRYLKFSCRNALQRHLDDYVKAFPGDVILPAALQHALSRGPGDCPLSVPYVGISSAVDAQERAEQDKHDRQPTRRQNFTADLDVQVYELADLRVPISSTLQFRTDPCLGNLEVFLIALQCGICLNSAPGGHFPRPAFASEDLDTIRAVRESRTASHHYSLSPEQIARAQHHYKDEFEFWQAALHRRLPPAALDASVRAALTPTVGVLHLKDTTQETIDEQISYWSELAGPAPAYSHFLWQVVLGASDAGTQHSAEPLYALFNHWDFVPGATYYGAATAFASRFYAVRKPPVAFVEGSFVWNCSSKNHLSSWPTEMTPTDAHAFTEMIDSSKLTRSVQLKEEAARAEAPLLFWQRQEEPNFVEAIGLPRLQEVAPGQLCVHVPCFDSGSWKHRHLLFPLESRLSVLSRLSYTLAVDVAKQETPDVNSCEAMSRCFQLVLDRLDQHGLTTRIKEAQAEFRQALTAYSGLVRSGAAGKMREQEASESDGLVEDERLRKERQQFHEMTVKMVGSQGSTERIAQVKQILDTNRSLARAGRRTDPRLSLLLGDDMPTSQNWALRLIRDAKEGVSLDYFAFGTQSHNRDTRPGDVRKANEAHRKQKQSDAAVARSGGQRCRIDGSAVLTELISVQNVKKRNAKPAYVVRCSRTPPCQAATFLVRDDNYGYHCCQEQPLDPMLANIAAPAPPPSAAVGPSQAGPSDAQTEDQPLPRAKAPRRQHVRAALGKELETTPVADDESLQDFFSSLVSTGLPKKAANPEVRNRGAFMEKIDAIPNRQLARLDVSRGKRKGVHHAMHLLTHRLTAAVLQAQLLHCPPPLPLVAVPVSSCLLQKPKESDAELGHILVLASEAADPEMQDKLKTFLTAFAKECLNGAKGNKKKGNTGDFVPLPRPSPEVASFRQSLL